MKEKAKDCMECEFRRFKMDSTLYCDKDHNPRFYKPKGNPYFTDWGWKRRCDDFVLGKHVGLERG